MILERLGTGIGKGFDLFAAPGVKETLSRLDPKQRGPAIALLKDVAERGIPTLKTQCNVLGDGIFELKPPGIRLPFFYDSTRRAVIITHVMKKQKFRMPPREIKHAKQIRRRVVEAQEEGSIRYE